jgi:hypothetical protein
MTSWLTRLLAGIPDRRRRLARLHDFRIRIHRASDASGVTCDALDRGPGMQAGSDRNRHELNGHWLSYSLGHTVVSVSGMGMHPARAFGSAWPASCTAERERSAFSDVATSRTNTQSDAEHSRGTSKREINRKKRSWGTGRKEILQT